jgi:hypothetical protein
MEKLIKSWLMKFLINKKCARQFRLHRSDLYELRYSKRKFQVCKNIRAIIKNKNFK